MKYFYNLLDGFKEPDRFYDEQTIRRFRVYPATPEIEKEAYENPHSDLWPVHDIHNMMNCVSIWKPTRMQSWTNQHPYKSYF